MLVEDGKIKMAIEDELYDYYISRGFDDVMSFDEYMSRCKELGTKLVAGWKSGLSGLERRYRDDHEHLL